MTKEEIPRVLGALPEKEMKAKYIFLIINHNIIYTIFYYTHRDTPPSPSQSIRGEEL